MKVLTVRSAILSRQSNVRLLAQSVNDESYQYLQKGKLPMLFFQNSLPRLPIPDLEKTCQRYLDAQRPILTDEEFHTTEHNVQR
jgi:carnitine O-palmitoyltransferase 2